MNNETTNDNAAPAPAPADEGHAPAPDKNVTADTTIGDEDSQGDARMEQNAAAAAAGAPQAPAPEPDLNPEGGLLQDVPKVDKNAAMVLLRLDPENPTTLRTTVIIGDDRPDFTNVAHFFAHWLNTNIPALVAIAGREYGLLAELREAESRQKLSLLGPDGNRLN